MTNNEYEKLSVEAATGQAWLKGADEMIEHLEKQLAEWQEYRRELINRFNLNKGGANAIAAGKIHGVTRED